MAVVIRLSFTNPIQPFLSRYKTLAPVNDLLTTLLIELLTENETWRYPKIELTESKPHQSGFAGIH